MDWATAVVVIVSYRLCLEMSSARRGEDPLLGLPNEITLDPVPACFGDRRRRGGAALVELAGGAVREIDLRAALLRLPPDLGVDVVAGGVLACFDHFLLERRREGRRGRRRRLVRSGTAHA